MKRLIALFLTLILCVTVCACGGSAPPEPSPTPTPTPTPVPTPSPEELAGKYDADMAAAIGSDDRAPLTAGKAVTYWEDEYKLGSYNTKLLADEWIAETPEEAKFIVYCAEGTATVGYYTGTIACDALQRYVNVKILNSVSGTTLAEEMFYGSEPPQTITRYEDRYGSYPEEDEIAQWILSSLTASIDTEKEAALKQAHTLLDYAEYSKAELRNELITENGYTPDEAAYAAENCGADWKKQALEFTKVILEGSARSRSAILKILTDDKLFTVDEANYALDNCGADWGTQSNAVVDQVLSSGEGYSRDGLIQVLVTYKGMTQEDAELAADQSSIDWNEQAVLVADKYLNKTSGIGYSPESLVSRMCEPVNSYGAGFTKEQAQYAVDHVKTDWNVQAAKAAARWIEYWDASYYGELNEENLLWALTDIDQFTEEQARHGMSTVTIP